jgi:hopene-associated glycosyltransferase HpnB
MFLPIALGLAITVAWIYLAIGNGLFWLPLLPDESAPGNQFPSIDVIVPARNEADVLPKTLPSLLTQAYAGPWKIILVDDHSKDETAEAARKIAAEMKKPERLTVISAPDLPEGWSGKVAAMNAGVAASAADFILFTDADIRHSRRSLEKLVASATTLNLDLVSRMVKLNCETVAERLLIPAFVFFFAMLYPFRRANTPNSLTAAAAGGVMLVRRTMLDCIGGLATIKSALIDDCSLAKALKDAGASTEIMLTSEIASVRTYPRARDVVAMISRTAYTQLKHSPALLMGTIMGLALLFVAPFLLFLFAPMTAAPLLGLGSIILMLTLYIPMVHFYRLPLAWALTLPVAALVYAFATIDSARLYHQGHGGQWKGRAQA